MLELLVANAPALPIDANEVEAMQSKHDEAPQVTIQRREMTPMPQLPPVQPIQPIQMPFPTAGPTIQPIPKSFELHLRPDGSVKFENGKIERTRTDVMGRTKVGFPGQTNRTFSIPYDQSSGFITMPDGSQRHLSKTPVSGGETRVKFD